MRIWLRLCSPQPCADAHSKGQLHPPPHLAGRERRSQATTPGPPLPSPTRPARTWPAARARPPRPGRTPAPPPRPPGLHQLPLRRPRPRPPAGPRTLPPGRPPAGHPAPAAVNPRQSLSSLPVHPGNAHPGNAHPGNAHPGNAHPGNANPGNANPGNVHPGMHTQGMRTQGRRQGPARFSQLAQLEGGPIRFCPQEALPGAAGRAC